MTDEMITATIKVWAKRVGATVVAVVLISGSVFSVDQTELANVRRFGVVQYPKDQPVRPGIHIKLPFVDTVDKLTVSMATLHIPPFHVLTIDNQDVTIEENFNYTISPDKVYHVLYEIGRPGDIDIHDQVIPVAHDRTARVFASQNMVTVNAGREAIQADIEKNVTTSVETLFGITPHSLQIAAIQPSVAFMASIDAATMAKNKAIEAENTLRTKQFEAEQVAATAKGAADAVRLQADAAAYSTTVTAKADAEAIHIKSTALNASPAYVDYIKAERWNGALPTTMVPGSAMPFMNLKSGN